MTRLPLSLPVRVAAGLFLASLLLSGASLAAEYSETFTFDGNSLYVGNLVGEIEVVPGGGSSFEVVAHVRGDDAQPGLIRFETKDGNRARLAVVFPVDKHKKYVYPEGPGRTTMSYPRKSDDSWLREVMNSLSGKRITVSRDGTGIELWVDVTVRVPSGSSLQVEHGIGKVRASDVTGDLELGTSSGRVEAASIRGSLDIDTGSGSVEVADVSGEVVVDTGSGKVELSDVDGDRVSVDTGSGSVVARRIRTRALEVDTGSGSVTAEDVETDSASIDTGSGSVTLALVQMGDGDFDVDTGSGSITLVVPSSVSADVEADTGSGGIRLDVDDVKIVTKERDYLRAQVGGDGGARVRLDTGSGSIRIREG